MWLDLPDQSSGTGGYEEAAIHGPTTPGQIGTSIETISGYVIYRLENGTVEYLLLKKANINDWSPPKGHVEAGEECLDGAEREVLEETGFTIDDYETLEKYPIYFEYKTREQVQKQVHLWAARYLNRDKPVRLSPEHDGFQWTSYEAATAVVKHQYREALMAADLVVRTYESL